MKLTTLFVCIAVLLLPAAAWGATCTTPTGAVTLGPVTAMTPDCVETGDPDGTSAIVIQDGSALSISDPDIAFTAADTLHFTIESGGSLSADASSLEDAVVIHLINGDDGISVGGTSYNDVAVWGEAGSTLNFQAGYLKWRLATPAYATEVTQDNGTLNTVDWFAPCDDGSVGNLTGFSIGGNGDCTTGDQEYGFSLLYTNARNNPEDGGTGDSYLDESVTHIASKNYDHYLACFTSGMSRDHCYLFQDGDIDSTGPEYALVLSVTQMTQDGAIDQVQYPRADRQQILINPSVAASKGAACFETAGGDLTADGDYVDACAYFFDSSGQNGWSSPRRIIRTEDGEDCDGGAGGDAWYIAADNPLEVDVAIADDVVITPICVSQGDKYYVMAPVWLEGEEAVGSGYVLGGSKVLLEGGTRFRGVMASGIGLMLCEGSSCDWNTDDITWMGSGTDAGPAMMFQDTAKADTTCFHLYGGPQTGSGLGILFDGVTGKSSLKNGNILYVGGEAIYSAASAAMGPLLVENVGLERTEKGLDGGIDPFTIADGSWDRVVFHDIFTSDATSGTASRILDNQSTTIEPILNGIAIAGQVFGGLSKSSTTKFAKAYNVLARGIDADLGGKVWGGNFVEFVDAMDTKLTNSGSDGAIIKTGAGDGILQHVYSEGLVVDNDKVVKITDGTTAKLLMRNNVFHNSTSLSANCSNGTGCNFVYLTPDNDADTVSTIEHNLFSWDADQTTQWTSLFYSTSTTGDKLNFGGNALHQMNNDVADATVKAIDLDATLAADSVQRGDSSNNCVSSSQASGGGTASIEYVDDIDQYPTTPIVGLAGESSVGRHVIEAHSRWAQLECGTLTGTRAPGMGVGHEYLYERMGIPKPERKPLVTREPEIR